MAVSTFVIKVPEAEPLVAQWRERFDPAARRGLGAHITLWYPFMAPADIDVQMTDAARRAAASMHAFRYQLTRVARFPGTLYLAAEPVASFAQLAIGLARAFPDCAPPQAAALIPHVSVVRARDVDDRQVESELREALHAGGPIDCRCREIELIGNAGGAWQTLARCALGEPQR